MQPLHRHAMRSSHAQPDSLIAKSTHTCTQGDEPTVVPAIPGGGSAQGCVGLKYGGLRRAAAGARVVVQSDAPLRRTRGSA